MSVIDDTINVFNVVVLEDHQRKDQSHVNLVGGYVTDFLPSPAQASVLGGRFKPIDANSFFTKEERLNSSPAELITKQILHYIEVYGLGVPGLFNLEMGENKIFTLNYVKGVTKEELSEMVLKLLYSNAPVKDIEPIKNMIINYRIKFDIDKVLNNELRIVLFNVNTMKYKNGDDAVRYIVWVATGKPLLIKSKDVIDAVRMYAHKIPTNFFENHAFELSQVFNRHKRLIMSAKSAHKAIINKISRMSKKNHVPVYEALSKKFISEYLNGNVKDLQKALSGIKVRDKFKLLNLLRYKRLQRDTDVFVIRNGRAHVSSGRKKLALGAIGILERNILESLKVDLAPLAGKNILLDTNVDYGLPISRKQTVGNLPFGSEVFIDGNEISTGIHWRNEWGANDLDLSTIDENGQRTGWGQYSGYGYGQDIVYSGDVTWAADGAMEFMTSKKTLKNPYGLFVNVFAGYGADSKYELVVGTSTEKQWMTNVVVREKLESGGKNAIIGFVRNGHYYAYKLSVNGSSVSGGPKETAMIAKASAEAWTVSELLCELDINFDVDIDNEKVYDYDMTYNQFSYDKLENLFGI